MVGGFSGRSRPWLPRKAARSLRCHYIDVSLYRKARRLEVARDAVGSVGTPGKGLKKARRSGT